MTTDQQQRGNLQADILVVDDTPENLRLLSTMLVREGFYVRKALNGSMALTAIEALPPDLVLLDIMMPEMDGFEVCERLKANPATREIPVIFLSAVDSTFDKVKAFQVGGTDYITKPFQIEEVLARINHQLSLKVATQKIRQLNASLEERVQERTNQLERAHTQLLELILRDQLTGLDNRIAFVDRLDLALKQSQSDTSYQFAVLFLDCDRFKIINDSLGHECGDQLLISISERLCQLLHPPDIIARLGGDEFAILLTQIQSAETATQFCEKILKVFSDPFTLQDQRIFINVSIGIVIGNATYHKPEHLLRDADTAMYHAKAAGKAQYRLFESTMHESALRFLQIETDLRKAIREQEFVLHYQPIVSLNTGKIVGLEALVRWHHPDRGVVLPSEFIPIAEETGLISQLGMLVLHKACYQLSTWQRQNLVKNTFSISVNLSARQFARANLAQQIYQILADTGLDPNCLKLEVTESAIMSNPRSAADILHDLRQHQIQLSMDDFGTGYSSLSYLHSFPMDSLKIDRSFVQGLNETSNKRGLVPIIVAIAKTMSMSVIAEGIETYQQLEQLRSLQCDFGQGYLFSKPLPANDVIDLITSNPSW
ncbi:diguanylate cyclase (GGDEF) domain-containing protein [Leptolyngbyaceae cyanobacterium JSC-12]|nr:diguanylate cyclase (GGDEF) domain-containing protein [Leptolyngbyaceae cyanobacterium JSC-12]